MEESHIVSQNQVSSPAVRRRQRRIGRRRTVSPPPATLDYLLPDGTHRRFDISCDTNADVTDVAKVGRIGVSESFDERSNLLVIYGLESADIVRSRYSGVAVAVVPVASICMRKLGADGTANGTADDSPSCCSNKSGIFCIRKREPGSRRVTYGLCTECDAPYGKLVLLCPLYSSHRVCANCYLRSCLSEGVEEISSTPRHSGPGGIQCAQCRARSVHYDSTLTIHTSPTAVAFVLAPSGVLCSAVSDLQGGPNLPLAVAAPPIQPQPQPQRAVCEVRPQQPVAAAPAAETVTPTWHPQHVGSNEQFSGDSRCAAAPMVDRRCISFVAGPPSAERDFLFAALQQFIGVDLENENAEFIEQRDVESLERMTGMQRADASALLRDNKMNLGLALDAFFARSAPAQAPPPPTPQTPPVDPPADATEAHRPSEAVVSGANSSLQCPVCLEPVERSNMSVPRCGHVVCNACLRTLLKERAPKCPNCREVLCDIRRLYFS